ncbi:MAG TPA: envelope stress response membrane protein PspB [Thiotrichales bacterium]|nr:envelope stress response membrane protein PspB [Thiotrichales bacterium]
MEDVFLPIIMIFMIFVAPLWLIMHYYTRLKTSGSLSREDETMLRQLWESSQRMEERIRVLETILDDEVPDWRSKSR